MLRSILSKSNRILCTRILKDSMPVNPCHVKVQTNLPIYLSQHSFWSKGSQKSDDNLTTVYVGQQKDKVYRVKIFSLCTSLMGVTAQPLLMQKVDTLGQLILANTFVGFFTFVTPILLHLVTKKYVTKVEYDAKTDTYTATQITFFLSQRKVTFGPGEAVVPDLPSMFTTFTVKGVPMLVDATDFDVQHYSRILGYDKPLDFKIRDVEPDPPVNYSPANVPKSKKVE